MAKLTSSDWTAIKWYMNEFGYKIKDMMVYPTVRFRNKDNEIVDVVDLFSIKEKYKARPRAKKVKQVAS